MCVPPHNLVGSTALRLVHTGSLSTGWGFHPEKGHDDRKIKVGTVLANQLESTAVGILDIFSKTATAPIEAVGNIVLGVFGDKGEKLSHAEIMARIAQEPHLVQTQINMIEAGSRHWFTASWRPAIGWVCALSLLNYFLINPWIQWATGVPGPDLPHKEMMQLALGILGLLGTMRTVEKSRGVSK